VILINRIANNYFRAYELPYEANVDWQLYDVLKKEYLKFLSLDSFVVDTADFWKRRKQEERCYAVNLMFYKEQL